MIICRTPFRISFFGGGTDYPAWSDKHGGAVLSTTFDKYSYITCRRLPPFFDHNYRVTYSRLEHVRTPEEIEHPAIRAVIKDLFPDEGLEIHCDADLPARSGLGSSSSFVVGLLHALHGLQGKRVTQEWLAREAIRYEQKVLNECVGCQDQVAAAVGGFNIIHFLPGGGFRVEPLILSAERKAELNRHLLLFFTGFSRISSAVAQAKVNNLESRGNELRRIRAMVDESAELLASNRDIRQFGELLHQTWIQKKTLSDKVTTPHIDAFYERATAAGALGGKLLGAGSGGFMLLFASPDRQNGVKKALDDLIHVPFEFETGGSVIVYYR